MSSLKTASLLIALGLAVLLAFSIYTIRKRVPESDVRQIYRTVFSDGISKEGRIELPPGTLRIDPHFASELLRGVSRQHHCGRFREVLGSDAHDHIQNFNKENAGGIKEEFLVDVSAIWIDDGNNWAVVFIQKEDEHFGVAKIAIVCIRTTREWRLVERQYY